LGTCSHILHTPRDYSEISPAFGTVHIFSLKDSLWFLNFSVTVPEIFENIFLNCSFENTFYFQLILPKAVSAIIKGLLKVPSSQSGGFLKTAEEDNF
jgi:hypothetical protein